MNRLLALVASTAVLAGSAYALNLTDAASFAVLAASVAMGLVAIWIITRTVSQHTWHYSVLVDDQPLAAAVFGILRGVVLTAIAACGFAIAWAMGGRSPPHVRSVASEAMVEPLDAPSKVEHLGVAIAKKEYHEPFLFLDVTVLDDQQRPVEGLTHRDFSVRVGEDVRLIHTATATHIERPLNVVILRDASGSIRFKPFPDYIAAATHDTLQALNSSPRSARVRVANFSNQVFEVTGWTDRPDEVATGFDPTTLPADHTSLVTSTVATIEDLALRSGVRRIVLATDGGDNVPSDYSTAGLIAHARRHNVAIHVVALPTDHLQDAQRKFLQRIARDTGGIYIDAATSAASRQLQQVIKADRDLQAAYRITVEQAFDVPLESISVELANPLVGLFAKPGKVPSISKQR